MKNSEEGSLPKKAFSWNSPGRDKRGRPKKIWLYGVLENMKKNILANLWEDGEA